MACLGVKRDGKYNPHHSKSRIIVLRNHEYLAFNKSQRFALFLSYSSIRLLTSKSTKKRCILQQAYGKNYLCNALLPDKKLTIVLPPLVDPDSSTDDFWLLNKTLYGLRRSPQHWYNLI